MKHDLWLPSVGSIVLWAIAIGGSLLALRAVQPRGGLYASISSVETAAANLTSRSILV